MAPKTEGRTTKEEHANAKDQATENSNAPAALSGTGKFFYMNGATYEGDWKYDMAEVDALSAAAAEADAKKKGAKGKKKDDDQSINVEGLKRIRHGTGKYAEGDYWYSGQWDNDDMHGTGTFQYASGATYDGEWQHNKYHGSGKYTWPDGRTYEGEWQENRMHGHGVYTDAEGHKWEGQYFNGSGPGLTYQL